MMTERCAAADPSAEGSVVRDGRRRNEARRDRQRLKRDESGAVLLLALIFMVVTALIITSLAAWSGNDISNVGHLKSGRSVIYTSDAAIQVAISDLRYAYQSSSSNGYCPNTPSGNPYSLNGQKVYATCAIVVSGGMGNQDIEVDLNVAVYPSPLCPSDYTSCNHPYVQAQVAFIPFDNSNTNSCTPTSQSTCGFGMTVKSWVVQPGLS